MVNVPDVDDQIRFRDFLKRGLECRHQLVRELRDESDRVREDRGAPRWQLEAPQRGVEGREEQILGAHSGLRQAVEERRLAGVRVTHERHDRIGHALARIAMERARPLGVLELLLDFRDPLADQPAVDLQLALAGAAKEAEAAALPLEVGPGPDQPRALIGERRELDLKPSLVSAGPGAEDLEDEARAVDDLAAPGLLQVALLDRAHGAVDHRDPDALLPDHRGQPLDAAPPDQLPRPPPPPPPHPPPPP